MAGPPEERRLIVINNTWALAPWADLLYACDGRWWDVNAGAPEFGGLKFTQDRKAAERFGLTYVPAVCTTPEKGRGLCLTPPVIHTGANSGYQAVNLAVHLGARRIVLLGFDIQAPGGSPHWHGFHGNGLNNPNAFTYAAWLDNWKDVPASLEGTGVEVVNASRKTALMAFPRVALEDVLCSSSAGSLVVATSTAPR